MNKVSSITDAEIPLIEEQVDTGLSQLLENYRPNYIPGGDKKDDLMGRFTLNPNRPLPEFDHPYAKAFEAQDDFNESRAVYALVCDPNMPVRIQTITEMTAAVHPNLVSILGAGTVNCSHLGESRMVIFFERPRGQPLTDFIKKGTRMHEHKVIDFVLNPAVKALQSLQEKKVSHGHIHPGNFYLSDTSQLGDYVSAPSGTMNHYLYEPLERMMAEPLGRGMASEKSDVYSLGMLAFELMYGLEKFKSIPKETLIERFIQHGTYHMLATNREFSDTFQDFFRGIFNENPSERWGIEELTQWVNGKRFNMIAPSAPKEAARPLVFVSENFFGRRILAHALHAHWREAIKEIRNLKIDRWCEASLHRPELAEKLERTLRLAGMGSTDAQVSDMLTRVICILDPTAPLRTQALSLRPAAIGPMLADIVQHNGPELAQLLALIENDMGNFWSEQSESNKTPEMSKIIWRLQRVRPYLKNKDMGFGLERVLYDLNPSLCCQSEILKPYHVTTSLDALKTLDALAPKLAATTSFVDRHLAAFVASKADFGKEIRLSELEAVPELASNQELVIIKMLAKAQQKHAKLQLVGLSAWVAMRVEQMIDTIHNRLIRKRLKLQLKKQALTGNLFEVLATIMNVDVTERDLDGFANAIALHQFNYDRIERLKNEDILEFLAKRTGGKLAMSISYIALAITGYITFTDMFGI
jgi:serine/threonine protein kinase